MQAQVREQVGRLTRLTAAAALLAAPAIAHASFLSGDTLDAAANVLAWFVLIVMPLVAVALFWYVHILPEKIAEKRHHPQKDSIKILCLLSLVFGGLLWPFAWLWAYTRPVAFRHAYGIEKHEDYYIEMGEKARLGELVQADIERLRAELATMESKGALPPELLDVREALEDLATRQPGAQHPGGRAATPVGGND